MAILVIDQAPGVTAEKFEEMVRQIGSDTLPAGQIARLAGPVEGGWRVISVWESQEALEAFRRDRLTPAAQQSGITEQVQFAPLHSVAIAPQYR